MLDYLFPLPTHRNYRYFTFIVFNSSYSPQLTETHILSLPSPSSSFFSSLHFVTSCFSFSLWPSSSLPLTPQNSSLYFLSISTSISPFTFHFSSWVSLQSEENYLIIEYINTVTSTTYVFFSCNVYTYTHWFFTHTNKWDCFVCTGHVNHRLYTSFFLLTWLVKSVKISNWFMWLDSITLCLVCYDMPWFPDILVNFELWHFLWNMLLLFLEKDICKVSSFTTPQLNSYSLLNFR